MRQYLSDLHDTYSQTTRAFKEAYPYCDEKMIEQVDNYSRACAIFLWQKFNTDLRVCTDAINKI